MNLVYFPLNGHMLSIFVNNPMLLQRYVAFYFGTPTQKAGSIFQHWLHYSNHFSVMVMLSTGHQLFQYVHRLSIALFHLLWLHTKSINRLIFFLSRWHKLFIRLPFAYITYALLINSEVLYKRMINIWYDNVMLIYIPSADSQAFFNCKWCERDISLSAKICSSARSMNVLLAIFVVLFCIVSISTRFRNYLISLSNLNI